MRLTRPKWQDVLQWSLHASAGGALPPAPSGIGWSHGIGSAQINTLPYRDLETPVSSGDLGCVGGSGGGQRLGLTGSRSIAARMLQNLGNRTRVYGGRSSMLFNDTFFLQLLWGQVTFRFIVVRVPASKRASRRVHDFNMPMVF
jgi:hypothetical protein